MHRGIGLTRFDLRTRVVSFWDMSKKKIVEFSRYPVAFVALFVQIFLIIAMFLFASLAFTPSGSDPSTQRGLGATVVYGFIVGLFLSFTLWEIGFSIREEQTRGTLESLYLSPASKVSSLVARTFAILLWSGAMSFMAIVFVGGVVGGLPTANIAAALLVLAFSISGFLGIGFIFAGVTIKLKETAQFLVNGLQFFFMIFSAQFFPFSALRGVHPFIVDGISKWLPVSYCVDAFRSLLLGLPPGYPELGISIQGEVLIVVAFGILSPIIGYWIYKRFETGARRQGSLGEY
ncbi:MAG TPA: ABC transporter permease [Thermoplasmata archaeon]|nr:ABC transporter permease [Thermoplasmata archaeon]